MKRIEMRMLIADVIHLYRRNTEATTSEGLAEMVLDKIEAAGMKPPCVDGDKCQAIMNVYIDSTFNRWDEDFDKDEKLVAAYNRRMNRKNSPK